MQIKISDSELEVMRILWRENKPLSFAEIREELEHATQWSPSTIKTLVARLRDKNIISTSSNYVNLYTPNITQAQYIQAQEKSFIGKLFGGSAKKLVASLWQSGQLGDDDIDELRALLKKGGDEK